MKPYKNRQIDLTKPVLVYRNLHKNGFSIKQNSLVVAHADKILLKNCTFHVNKRGRQKVLITKQKNVHAYIKGFICESIMGTSIHNEWKGKYKFSAKIEYNPYKYENFTLTNLIQSNKIVEAALAVQLDFTGIYGVYLETSNIRPNSRTN